MIRHLHDYSLVPANIDMLSKRALRKICPRDQMADQLDFLLEIRLRNLRRWRSLSLGLIWWLRWCRGRGRRWFFQPWTVKLPQDMDVEAGSQARQWASMVYHDSLLSFSFARGYRQSPVRSKMLFLHRIANQSLLFLARKRADDLTSGNFFLRTA